MEYPQAAFAAMKSNLAKSFDEGEKGFAMKGKIMSRKDITLDGNAGREIVVQQNDGTQMQLRLVLAFNRLYIFGIVDPNVANATEIAGIFFENFKLKP